MDDSLVGQFAGAHGDSDSLRRFPTTTDSSHARTDTATNLDARALGNALAHANSHSHRYPDEHADARAAAPALDRVHA